MSNGISLDVGQQESSNSPSLKVVRPRVEEIISGKIPQEFTPNLSRNDEGDIVTGKIPGFYSSGKSLGTDNGRKRTGSFVDLNSSSISDTSDLVVSSMIKFSWGKWGATKWSDHPELCGESPVQRAKLFRGFPVPRFGFKMAMLFYYWTPICFNHSFLRGGGGEDNHRNLNFKRLPLSGIFTFGFDRSFDSQWTSTSHTKPSWIVHFMYPLYICIECLYVYRMY